MATQAEILSLCRHSLAGYAIAQWADYQVSEHHRLIARALERVASGECTRLIITMPPRHGKSQLASEFFPAWYLGLHPDRQVIHATYAQELADGFGRKVRNQIKGDLFRAVFPECEIAEDSQAAARFHTGRGGVYHAVGVGGAATGRGAHCIPEGVRVKTLAGDVCIEDLKIGTASGIILTYSVDTERLEFKKLQATQSRHAEELFRFTTKTGRVVEATGNHLIFANGQWKTADSIAEGDSFVCVLQDGVRPSGIRVHEEHQAGAQRSLLQQGLLEKAPRNQECESVREVRRTDSYWWGVQKREVLQGVPPEAEGAGGDLSCDRKALPDMQHSVLGEMARRFARKARGVLLKALRGDWAFTADVERKQPEVEGRCDSASATAALREGVQADAQSDTGAGRKRLRGVRNEGYSSGGASHRQLADEQRSVEPCDVVLPLSQEMARCDGLTTVSDVVARIERVRKETRVFDIQVEGNNNFFAGEVLVHNCLLIDDPIKGREEAESETQREKLKDWYRSVAYTRLMKGGAIVMIQTRWHMDDLAGWVLEEHQHEGWEVLSLPALDDQGEALWPEMYPPERLLQIKETIGPRDWEALYQQRPVATTGGDFKRSWIQWYGARGVEHKDMTKIMLVDPASGKRTTNDYTSAWIIGLGGDDNYYVLDIVRDRLNLTERAEMVFRLHRKWRPAQVRYERYGMMADVEYLRQEMERRAYRFALHEVGGATSKEDRIRRLVPLFETGRMWFPQSLDYVDSEGKERDMVETFVEQELLTFPSSRHDDMLDGLARIAEPSMALPWPRKREQSEILEDMGGFVPFSAEYGY